MLSNYIDLAHRSSNCVITSLSIAVALAAHVQPHPKSKHHHQQTDNHHILLRISLITLSGMLSQQSTRNSLGDRVAAPT
jgi:hypothetical protein